MTRLGRHILFFVHDSLARVGVCPSMNEIAAHTGATRPTVTAHIERLVADGWLRRNSLYRGFEVTRLPGDGLTVAEIAWCHANPARVRAMMRLTEPAREVTA